MQKTNFVDIDGSSCFDYALTPIATVGTFRVTPQCMAKLPDFLKVCEKECNTSNFNEKLGDDKGVVLSDSTHLKS